MPVYLKLINYDDIYQKAAALNKGIVLLNDFERITPEGQERLRRAIRNDIDPYKVSMVPRCACPGDKALVGEFLRGTICPNCKAEVGVPIEAQIYSKVWVRRPEQIRKFINPAVMTMLFHTLKASSSGNDVSFSDFKPGHDPLRWLINKNHRIQQTRRTGRGKSVSPVEAIIFEMQNRGLKRGWNNFVDNFDEYLDILFDIPALSGNIPKDQHPVYQFIKEHRDCVFSDYQPLLDSTLLPIEKFQDTVYSVDKNVMKCLEFTMLFQSLVLSVADISESKAEALYVKALSEIVLFYGNDIKEMLKKKGIVRKHIIGTRSPFTFRCVASVQIKGCRYNEVMVPWGVGVTALRPMLLNKLLRRGYVYKEAVRILIESVERYHPLLDTILKELLEERGGYMPILLNRNPSIWAGSVLLVKIVGFKTDPSDHTIGVHPLIVTSLNLDFDGDELNCMLVLDKKLEKRLYKLKQYHIVREMNKPNEVGSAISLIKNMISIANLWLNTYGDGAIAERNAIDDDDDDEESSRIPQTHEEVD